MSQQTKHFRKAMLTLAVCTSGGLGYLEGETYEDINTCSFFECQSGAMVRIQGMTLLLYVLLSSHYSLKLQLSCLPQSSLVFLSLAITFLQLSHSFLISSFLTSLPLPCCSTH